MCFIFNFLEIRFNELKKLSKEYLQDIEEDIVELYEKDESNHKTSKLFLMFAGVLVGINYFVDKK